MNFYRLTRGAGSRELKLTLLVLLVCFQEAIASTCWRIAECTCQSPERLLCSGRRQITIEELLQIVAPALVLFLDLRDRYFTAEFLGQVIDYFPNVKVVQVQGCSCDVVWQYIGKTPFILKHSCGHIDPTIPGLITSTVSDRPSTVSPFPWSSSPASNQTSTWSSVQTSTWSSVTDTPSEPVSPPIDIPTSKGDIVVVAGHSTGFYCAVIIPPSAVVAIIAGIIAACCRYFKNRAFVAGVSGGHPTSADTAPPTEPTVSVPNKDTATQSSADPSAPDSVKKSEDSKDGLQNVKTESAGDDCVSTVRSGEKDKDITFVKVPLDSDTTLVATDGVQEGDVTVINMPDSAMPFTTSTPQPSKGRHIQLPSCLAPNSPPYSALSPYPGSPPMSEYHTPCASMLSSAALIPSAKDKKAKKPSKWASIGQKLGLRSDINSKDNLEKGVAPATRAPRKKRAVAKEEVELSASIVELPQSEQEKYLHSVSSV